MIGTVWDYRWMERAKSISHWSKNPKHKVGCVIVSPDNHQVSEGYNGPPHGVKDEDLSSSSLRMRTVHAEMNAIINTCGSLEGCSIYTWPYAPCAICAGLIIQKKIGHVFYGQEVCLLNWQASQAEAIRMLIEAGIEMHKLEEV